MYIYTHNSMSHGILVFYILVSKHGALKNLTFTSVMLQRPCLTDGTSPSYLTNSPLVCEIPPFPPPDYIIIGLKNDILFQNMFFLLWTRTIIDPQYQYYHCCYPCLSSRSFDIIFGLSPFSSRNWIHSILLL